VLCIASGGCTAMALAPHHEVVAIDINPVQLAYAGSRFAGGRGIRGAAERLMDVGRSFAPLVGWRPSRLRTFLEFGDTTEQTTYWRQHLDTGRFRTAMDGLLSLTALRAIYAAPLLDCLPPRLGAVMRARMTRCFALHPNRENPYARALLLGDLPDAPPPAQAKDIRLVHGDAAGFLELQPAGSFDGFALSNILDGADAAYRRRLYAAVQRAAAPDARMVLRSFREASAALPTNRAADDRAMLWGIVDVKPVANLHEP
jgi:S-adenosylmethionine:diacylglycerol 3-amino-3-carboxypropyl transferase